MRFTTCLIGSLLCVAAFRTAVSRGQDWPEFRGPFANGHATAAGDAKPAGLPLHWSEKENVKWKSAIPYLGWSTPVVQGGQVWLTTATDEGNDFFVLCLDAATGKVQFNRKLFHADKPEPLGNSVNCYASPSPVIEAGRVYVSFGSYGTACLDAASGKTIWQRTDLPCRHYRGPGSSPILFDNLLILSMDGIDVQYLVALDEKTGQTVWKTDRTTAWDDLGADGKPIMEGDQRKAFSTPIIIDVDGKPMMISSASKAAYGYNPRTGEELWKVCHGSHTPASRPVFGEGLVMFATGMSKSGFWAVKPGGHGDVTQSQTAWKINSKAVPRMVSPLVVGELLFLVADSGGVSCLEIATGKLLWQHSGGGQFISSPIYADGRIYFFNLAGKGYVIKPGRTYELLATNTLDAGCMASPAVAGKALFVRTKTHLYRIECNVPTPTEANQVATNADLSGSAWWHANQAKYPNSKKVEDLEPKFRAKVEAFLAALKDAGIRPNIESTLRSKERAYVMHYCWDIAHDKILPAKVPPCPGVKIVWDHGDLAAGSNNDLSSKKAAQEMVDLFGMDYMASLTSHHIKGLAIDMKFSWTGTLKIKKQDGTVVEIKTTPRNGADNALMHEVGASYGVIKLVGDAPHWSVDGK